MSQDTSPLIIQREGIEQQPAVAASRTGFVARVTAAGAGLALFALAGKTLLPTSSSSAAISSDVVGLVEEGAPEFCTDGSAFGFSFTLPEDQADGPVLSTETGAMGMSLEGGQLTFTVQTLNKGQVSTSMGVRSSGPTQVTVSKDAKMLCIRKPGFSQCNPASMPTPLFQVKPMGALRLATSVLGSFEQTSGNVPIAFGLLNLPMGKLWENAGEWAAVTQKIKEAVAALSGDGTAQDVTVSPASPVNEKTTAFEATVRVNNPTAGAACAVQNKLQAAVQSKEFAAAIADRVQGAGLQSSTEGEVAAVSVSVPAQPMSCSKFRCRTKMPASLGANAQCVGGSCESVCCSPATLKTPMPFVPLEVSEEEPLAAAPTSLPRFVMPDLKKAIQKAAVHTAVDAISHKAKELPVDSATISFLVPALSGDAKGALQKFVQQTLHRQFKVAAEQVEVAVHTTVAGLKAPHGKVVITAPKETAEEVEARREQEEKIATLSSGKVWRGKFAGLSNVDEAEQAAKQVSGLESTDAWGAHEMAASAMPMRELSPGQPTKVDIVIKSCGPACKAKVEQVAHSGALEKLLQVHLLAGPGAVQKESSISNLQCPGEKTMCSEYECSGDMMLKTEAEECFGDDCDSVCCEPRGCDTVECEGSMERPWASGQTCSTEAECGAKCCEMPCSEKTCPCGYCPVADATTITDPENWMDTCCAPQPKCCDAPIAWCVSCLMCQSVDDYCTAESVDNSIHALKKEFTDAVIHGIFSHFHGDDEGRLLEDDDQMAHNISIGYLPAPGMPRNMPTEQLEATSVRGATDAKKNLRRLQATEARELKASWNSLAEEAAAFYHSQCEEEDDDVVTLDPTPAQVCLTRKAIRKNKVAKLACHGPRGCTSVSASACSYYYDTVFCLHRGVKPRPNEVNTVAVLQDTTHAVSCSDAGDCWVWRITNGKPRTHFLPIGGFGPMKSAAVLFDSFNIVSAGANILPFGGVAYIWDWRTGEQRAMTRCFGAPFMSATEIPEWRTVLLGCADGYTSLWNWNYNKQQRVPPITKSPLDVIAFASGLAKKCHVEALSGLGKLFDSEKAISEQTFMDGVLSLDPEVAEKLECVETIGKFFFGWSFGSVNAVSYVPTFTRFVTGHADGQVRYWNANTGALMMVMVGHIGPVNAIAGALTKQEAVSGGEDGTLRVWCLVKGIQKMLFIQDYGGPIGAVAVYPSDRMVVAGSADGYVRFWDLISGALLCAINTGGGAINGVAINPSGPLGQILAASADGYVRVFSPR